MLLISNKIVVRLWAMSLSEYKFNESKINHSSVRTKIKIRITFNRRIVGNYANKMLLTLPYPSIDVYATHVTGAGQNGSPYAFWE